MRPEIQASAGGSRDQAIDIIRGAGILMIGVDHLEFLCQKLAGPGFVDPFLTWQRIGWSSAAEFFVFFSGYLTGIVYLKTLQVHGPVMMWARAAQRSWHIYVLNLLSLAAVLLLMTLPAFFSADINEATRIDALMGPQAAAAILGFLTLRFEPLYFEILNLYIVLLLLAPIAVLLIRVSPVLAASLSVAVWAAVQLDTAFGVVPLVRMTGSFNPFAWQLMFVLGMLGGTYGIFRKLRERWWHRSLLVTSGSLLAFALLIKIIDRSGWSVPLIGSFDMPGYNKPGLGSLQLVHFLVSVVFVMQLIPQRDAAVRSLPMRAVAGVGRRSLECFCMSTILVYVLSAILVKDGSFDPLPLLLAGAAIVIALCLFAPLVDWVEAKPWRKPGSAPAAQIRKDDMPSVARRAV